MSFIGYIIGVVVGVLMCKYWYDTKEKDNIFGTIHVYADPETLQNQLYLELYTEIEDLLSKDEILVKVDKNRIILHEKR